jgi:hypothetical protein
MCCCDARNPPVSHLNHRQPLDYSSPNPICGMNTVQSGYSLRDQGLESPFAQRPNANKATLSCNAVSALVMDRTRNINTSVGHQASKSLWENKPRRVADHFVSRGLSRRAASSLEAGLSMLASNSALPYSPPGLPPFIASQQSRRVLNPQRISKLQLCRLRQLLELRLSAERIGRHQA